MKSEFTNEMAFKLETYNDSLNVRTWFLDGAPNSVTFSDPDQMGAVVSVPFDLWARVVAAVEISVDRNRTDGKESK